MQKPPLQSLRKRSIVSEKWECSVIQKEAASTTSWLKSPPTIHKCPQFPTKPQIHFHKWPKLLQLIIIVETPIELPRMGRQTIPKNKHSQLSISNYDDHWPGPHTYIYLIRPPVPDLFWEMKLLIIYDNDTDYYDNEIIPTPSHLHISSPVAIWCLLLSHPNPFQLDDSISQLPHDCCTTTPCCTTTMNSCRGTTKSIAGNLGARR